MTQTIEQPSRLARNRNAITVGIGDMRVSSSRREVLVTHSLGSCVGLALYDPVTGIGGLIHCMLPLSRVDREQAELKPCMFVDTGVPALLAALYERGAQRQDLIAKVAGAGSPLGHEETLPIGHRNYTVMRKCLWENEIVIDKEDVGGSKARALFLYTEDGRTAVKSEGQELEL